MKKNNKIKKVFKAEKMAQQLKAQEDPGSISHHL